jgi:hypothetical protein
MAKRSTRRMRGGFLEGIISLFTGEKKPVLPITTSNVTNTVAQARTNQNATVINVKPSEPEGATAPTVGPTGLFAPNSVAGGRRRRRSTRARSTRARSTRARSTRARSTRRKARSTRRKARSAHRKH